MVLQSKMREKEAKEWVEEGGRARNGVGTDSIERKKIWLIPIIKVIAPQGALETKVEGFYGLQLM